MATLALEDWLPDWPGLRSLFAEVHAYEKRERQTISEIRRLGLVATKDASIPAQLLHIGFAPEAHLGLMRRASAAEPLSAIYRRFDADCAVAAALLRNCFGPRERALVNS